MKKIKIFFIALIALLLIACDKGPVNKESFNKVIDEIISTIPEQIESDLNIPSTFVFEEKTFNISLTSNQPNIIGEDGRVYRGFKKQTVNLSIKASLADKSEFKEFDVEVKPLDLDEIKDLIIDLTDLDANILSDIDLPIELEYNQNTANLAWTSNDENIITNSGKVIFKTVDQTAKLSVKFKFEDLEYSFADLFELKIAGLSDADFLKSIANSIKLPKTTKTDLDLPSSLNGAIITWKSMQPSIISDSGELNFPLEDTEVEIEATIIHNGKSLSKVYKTTALSQTKTSFRDVVNEIILKIPYIASSDLDIPSTYTLDDKTYEINYTSNKPEIINEYGQVYRGFEKHIVTLSLRVSYADQYDQEDIIVEVSALSRDEVKNLIIDFADIPANIKEDLHLPTIIEYNNDLAELTWTSSDEKIITNGGHVNIKTEDQEARLSVKLEFNNLEYTFIDLFEVKIEALSTEEFLENIADSIDIPRIIKGNVSFPNSLNGAAIGWSSSDPTILSSFGVFNYPLEDTEIQMEATIFYNGQSLKRTFTITALTLTDEERIDLALESIWFPDIIINNLSLETSFDYNVEAIWISENPDIIDNSGKVHPQEEDIDFSLIVILKSGDLEMEKQFNLTLAGTMKAQAHHHLAYAKDYNQNSFINLKLEEDRLVLADDAIEGSYESPIYESENFTSLVASWAAITNTTTTAELQVRVRVDGTWSSYLSYSPFGLGLENGMPRKYGTVANLVEDEVQVLSSKTGNAFQYKVILRRNSLHNMSAKLSLVSIALNIPNYSFPVNIAGLPNRVEYDLPNLYQYDIPDIGGSICSPTTSTMLLMYHGHTFETDLPHGEIAPLFRDYSGSTGASYGNWVFNTVGMSAFGENSYVKRIYSLEELIHHLATVGPVGLSIRGETGRYNTGGHLIVVSGYNIAENGNRSILVHDPALKEVEWEYTETLYNGFTRNVIYVVENKN